MNKANKAFFATLAALSMAFPGTAFSADSFSFSGRVRENVGCLDIVPPPIKNATLTIYDNQSCIINAMADQRTSFEYGGRLTSYRAATDSAGYYRFGNCDADSFTCYQMKMNQIVEAEAEGYFPQRRDMVPERDSLLYFDLIKASGDSAVPVTVTVVAVDTAGHFAPVPLKNYRIEIPNRYLPWITAQAKDTTNEDGKAVFTLSVVPYADYRIVAKSLNGDNYSGESISNIAACNGNNITITVHIPRTMLQQGRFQEHGSYAVECFHNGFNSGMAISVRIQGGEHRREGILLHMFDLKGKSVGCFKGDAGREIPDHGRLYSFTIGDLPAGMYVLKMNIGQRSYSGKILFNR